MKKQKNPPFGDYPPKKMTKGLRRQLKKIRRQNPAEADRQETLIGRHT